MWWLVVILNLGLTWSSDAVAPVHVSCKNENNQNVDWFIMLKPPGGAKYIYIDTGGKKTMSSIRDGALAHTLAPMLNSVRNMAPSFGFLSYSDQPPGASALKNVFGHSKGVVMADSKTTTALWITHSTPQFPFSRDQNRFWPNSGDTNGQTFMCVSLPFSALTSVGNHLKNIRAYPFDHDLPLDFPQNLKDVPLWVHSETLLGKFQPLRTSGGKELGLMAKPTADEAKDGDLYVKLAKYFKSDMNVQTWGCQPKRDESFCDIGEPKVMNVENINTELGSWSTKKDHSKWGVTKENIGWTCLGDMNRATTQYERWGGAVCIKDEKVNKFFNDFAKSVLQCRKRPAPCSSSEMFSEVESLAENLQDKLEL